MDMFLCYKFNWLTDGRTDISIAFFRVCYKMYYNRSYWLTDTQNKHMVNIFIHRYCVVIAQNNGWVVMAILFILQHAKLTKEGIYHPKKYNISCNFFVY